MKHERKTQIRNNYEYAKEKIRPEFLKYDQETMIRRFQLKHDPDYIYLPFVGSEYRISRQTGEVERLLSDCQAPEHGNDAEKYRRSRRIIWRPCQSTISSVIQNQMHRSPAAGVWSTAFPA